MGVGFAGFSPNERPGVFDVVLGADSANITFARRWTRQAAGMSLRGLQQTAVPGAVFAVYGSGPSYLLSGVAMGWVYSLAWSVRGLPVANADLFAGGTQLGEVRLRDGWRQLRLLRSTCLGGERARVRSCQGSDALRG